jgi:two-component sensor histidine kinase
MLVMFRSQNVQSANANVSITHELGTRAPNKTDYRQEKLALQDLAACMADHPDDILPRLVDLALHMTGAVTGGLSLYEGTPDPGVFRWQFLRGTLSPFNGATTPRHYSPCGITLDQNAPVLVREPERVYDWLVEAGVSLPEVLLVPLYIDGTSPLGTLWVVSEMTGHFDSEHARVLTELASFVDIALRMVRSEERARKALEEQEILTREMNHRVQNLFAIVNSLIRTSKKGAANTDEMAEALSGRLHALQRAHDLVRSNVTEPKTGANTSDLASLTKAIVLPHSGDENGTTPIVIEGPPIQCGEQAASSIALVFHELATNAAKYGALKADGGRIAVHWRKKDGQLILRWEEKGGPTIDAPPEKVGFGSTLLKNSVTLQLGGTLVYDWQPSGLELEIHLPAGALAT